MNNVISFGKHEGKSFEWLLFKRPAYAQWVYENDIYSQDHFGEEEADHFLKLYERATNLGGTCCQCHERLVTKMGLTTSFSHHELLAVGFYCDECEYMGGARTGFFHPSFFVDAYTLDPGEKKMIIREIRRHYIGHGNLTQKKMKEFFADDANFDLPVPAAILVTLES